MTDAAAKRMSLPDAAALVHDGDIVVAGGCCYSRTPWAMLLELVRAQRTGLTLARNLMCYESELFLASGAADKLVSSWVGIGLRWGIPKVFREYVERDPSIYEEWSHLTVGLRFLAASMGMPFLPTASTSNPGISVRSLVRTIASDGTTSSAVTITVFAARAYSTSM